MRLSNLGPILRCFSNSSPPSHNIGNPSDIKNVGAFLESIPMNTNALPKTPAQVWRELNTDEKAIRVGQILRVIWEISKPIVAWTLFILAVGVWAVFTILVRGVFGSK